MARPEQVQDAPGPDRADDPLTRQVFWLMSMRVVIVTTLLLSALLIQSITGAYFAELNPIYYLVGLTYFLTLVYAGVHLGGWGGRRFLQTQLVGDLLIITGLIYYSGGLSSSFPFLYVLTIITASILLLRRGGLSIALVACVLYGALVALIYNNVISPPTGFLSTPSDVTMNQVYYNLFVRWIGFIAAALLSSYLAEKLAETGETLEERSADLEQLQVFYEDVINSVNSGLLSTDLDGRVGSLNHSGARILETSFGDVNGRAVSELFELPPETDGWLAAVGAEGVQFEHRFVAPSGKTKHLQISISRLTDRAENHRGFTFVIQDLTLLKQLEREVRLKDRMAALGGMAAGLAHEIRNPLASVSGSIQLLRGELDMDGEHRTLMDIVVNESGRLNRIVEEFLFYAKPHPPIPKRVDLQELAQRTVALFRNSSELTDGHHVEAIVDGDDHAVTADPDQLTQVLLNLLRNAVQAMPDGGRIWLRVGPGTPAGVALTVEDEGDGFGAGGREQLWEPFQTSRDEGTGLGLAVVYRIVKEHGGQVALGDRVPHGASVRIWLPRQFAGELAGSPTRQADRQGVP